MSKIKYVPLHSKIPRGNSYPDSSGVFLAALCDHLEILQEGDI